MRDGEVSDPNNEVPLAALQQTWRPATRAPYVKAFTQEVGPKHALPDNAKPLHYFSLFLPDSFFETAAKTCVQKPNSHLPVEVLCSRDIFMRHL